MTRRLVIDGAELWKLQATYGFPLEFSLMRCAEINCVPAWDRLLYAAYQDGVNLPQLIRNLKEWMTPYGDDAAIMRTKMDVLALKII